MPHGLTIRQAHIIKQSHAKLLASMRTAPRVVKPMSDGEYALALARFSLTQGR